MAMPGDESEAPPRLGDYLLEDVLSDGPLTRTYRASQVSMGRNVVLDVLKPEARDDANAVGTFLADVRAMAGVEHVGIGTVYEAVHHEENVYCAREWLRGRPLDVLREAGETLSPRRVVRLLRQVADAMEHLEKRGVATLPFEPRHLILDHHDVLRLVNLAVSGPPDPDVARHDRFVLADLFLDLLQRGAPGATRTTTLLKLMAERDGNGLTWTQVVHTARRLDKDLSEGAIVASQPIAPAMAGPARQSNSRRAMVALMIAVLLIGILGVAGIYLTRPPTPPGPRRDLGMLVRIPDGRYRTHNGNFTSLDEFWIGSHEVTISEYAEFLEALARLPETRRRTYDHPDQPPTKPDHAPDDWESMWTAARSAGTWDGLPVGLDYPVVEIDWWDACAYANWKGGRLPAQTEWLAASQDAELAVSPWGPVDAARTDVTPRSIHGLAGNVSEWVRDPAKNPAYPMNPKKPLSCGASYLNPRNAVRARIWFDSRRVRRRDLGFRIVRDTIPLPPETP